MIDRTLVNVELRLVDKHLPHHSLAVLLQLRDAVFDDALAFDAHGEVVVELLQLVAVQIRFAGFGDQVEELEAHVDRVVRIVVAELLREPVAPDCQANPLHDVVCVAGATDGVAVGTANGLGALQAFRVVTQESVFGDSGEVLEAGGFLGEDGDGV